MDDLGSGTQSHQTSKPVPQARYMTAGVDLLLGNPELVERRDPTPLCRSPAHSFREVLRKKHLFLTLRALRSAWPHPSNAKPAHGYEPGACGNKVRDSLFVLPRVSRGRRLQPAVAAQPTHLSPNITFRMSITRRFSIRFRPGFA